LPILFWGGRGGEMGGSRGKAARARRDTGCHLDAEMWNLEKTTKRNVIKEKKRGEKCPTLGRNWGRGP